MNVDVAVGGRPWKVAIEPAEQAGRFTVTIKGRTRIVDASWIDAETLSLIDRGAAHEIRLHPRDAGAVGVEIGGRLHEAVVAQNARLTPRRADAGRSQERGTPAAPGTPVGLGFSHTIKAPMPGRVVRVLVSVGDRVAARQPVVVVEAMKMENELRAPREGTVTEIAVAPGAPVENGAVLVVIGE